MPESILDTLKGFWAPAHSGVQQSDAPGTNERDARREGQDKDDFQGKALSPVRPYTEDMVRRSGPGPSGTLGYATHGDPVKLAARIGELNGATRTRFPQVATHGRPGPASPAFNVLYDVFKSTEAYDKVILGTAHGSWVVGTTVSQPVTLDVPLVPISLMNQFPGSVQIYPVLLLFTFGQSVTTATGEYSIGFTPQGGDFTYPLGEFNAGIASVFNSVRHIIRASITDPGQTNLGTIVITSNGVVGTPTIFWRMGFGFAAFLPVPAFRASEPFNVGDWITSAPEPERAVVPHGVPGMKGH